MTERLLALGEVTGIATCVLYPVLGGAYFRLVLPGQPMLIGALAGGFTGMRLQINANRARIAALEERTLVPNS